MEVAGIVGQKMQSSFVAIFIYHEGECMGFVPYFSDREGVLNDMALFIFRKTASLGFLLPSVQINIKRTVIISARGKISC